jgi:hypothetical protein
MNLKLGRNDPCYCGSGKKYKKCHLAEDEAKGHEAAAARVAEELARLAADKPLDLALSLPVLPDQPPPLSPPPLPPLTPEQEAEIAVWNARWEAFEQADFDARVRMFEEWLAADELDEEIVFDMFDQFHIDLVERGQRTTFSVLVEQLRAQAPELYEPNEVWFLSWLMEDAAAEREIHRLPALAASLAGLAEDNIDEVFRLIDLLRFHGQTDPLIELMSRAWPSVATSGEVLDSGITEFSGILMMLYIGRHLDRGGNPSIDDPGLRAELETLNVWQTMNVERMRLLISTLAGSDHAWTQDDFTRRSKDEDQLWENLMLLGMDWCGRIHRKTGMPLSRIDLARVALTEYLIEPPTGKHGRVNLLPGVKLIERKLAGLSSFLSGQYYKSGTLYALLPSYIDFVEARGLVSPEAARRTRKDLLKLKPEMVRLVTEATHDPTLIEAVQQT